MGRLSEPFNWRNKIQQVDRMNIPIPVTGIALKWRLPENMNTPHLVLVFHSTDFATFQGTRLITHLVF